MARFFFDLDDGKTLLRDDEGSDLLDVFTARERAEAIAQATVAQAKSPLQPYDPREFHVRAETGRRVAKIAFRYVTP